MKDEITPTSKVGTEFYEFLHDVRANVEEVTRQTVKECIASLGDRARHATRRQVFDAVIESLIEKTGVRPAYVYNKIAREFGPYLATAGGGPGTPNPFAAENGQTSDQGTQGGTNVAAVSSAAFPTNHEVKSNTDEDFVPFVALLNGEPSNQAGEEFQSMMRDAHVRVLNRIMSGSVPYGLARIDPDALFVGTMVWPRWRANGASGEAQDSAGTSDHRPTWLDEEFRIHVHLRALCWHAEGDPTLRDFPSLLQRGFRLSRETAWHLSRTLVRASYVGDLGAVQALVDACAGVARRPPAIDRDRGDKSLSLHVRSMWLNLCTKPV